MGYGGWQSEADFIGLCMSCSDEFDEKEGCSPLTGAVLMANACYDPEDAVGV